MAEWDLARIEEGGGWKHTFATVEMRERKRHIASQLAITPETFSRMLRHLSDRGLIEVMGYTIRVLDLARLRTVAKA